jgi:hypothetical protein
MTPKTGLTPTDRQDHLPQHTLLLDLKKVLKVDSNGAVGSENIHPDVASAILSSAGLDHLDAATP